MDALLRADPYLRASLSPEELGAQARAGIGLFGLSEAERNASDLLVQDDPGFGWDRRDPNRVQLIIVSRGDTYPHWNDILRCAFEPLDYDALAGLLR